MIWPASTTFHGPLPAKHPLALFWIVDHIGVLALAHGQTAQPLGPGVADRMGQAVVAIADEFPQTARDPLCTNLRHTPTGYRPLCPRGDADAPRCCRPLCGTFRRGIPRPVSPVRSPNEMERGALGLRKCTFCVPRNAAISAARIR